MDLVARQTSVGSRAVLHVRGEIDLATLPRLSDALAKATESPDDVVVDLDGVFVFDDAGLGLLLGAAARARAAGSDLVVVCSPGALRERLALTGFDRAVRVIRSLAELD